MPNRILREGILTSHRVDSLSDQAELFYRRLMSRLDDHGRYEAHPELLRTSCYPLRVDRVKAKQIVAWLGECEKAGLLVTYKAFGKSYVQAIDWRQQARSESKCPAPDAQLLSRCKANEHLGGGVGVVEDVGGGGSDAPSASALNAGSEVVCLIPLNDGSEYEVMKPLADELAKLYPAVDVPQTLNEIRGWNLANPTRRKTKRGIVGHLNSWMSREQNRGPKGS